MKNLKLKKLMKILAIGHSYIVDSNRAFWARYAELSKDEVKIICPKRWPSNLVGDLHFKRRDEIDGSLEIIPLLSFLKGHASFFFFNPFSFYMALKKNSPEVIFLFQETWSACLLQLVVTLLFLNKKERPKLTILNVCQNIKKNKFQMIHFFERALTSQVQIITHCNQEIVEVLNWKKITSKKYYLPFSYDERIYLSSIKEAPKQHFRVGYVGRLAHEKGLDILLLAMKKVREKIPGARLTIVGHGPLLALIQNDKGVDYFPAIPHNSIHLFYQNLDCLVLPSRTTHFWKEQFGRVLVEAVASGVPCVGSNSGAIFEVMSTMGLDNLFAENNPDQCADKIIEVYEQWQSGEIQKKITKAKQLAFDNFSHQQVALKFKIMLEQELKNKNGT